MQVFYKKYHLKKSGEGPGGKFNGPSAKIIVKEDTRENMSDILPIEASPFITYLRSLRELHRICTAKDLGDYDLKIGEFKKNFDHLYYDFNLSMTLKVLMYWNIYNFNNIFVKCNPNVLKYIC